MTRARGIAVVLVLLGLALTVAALSAPIPQDPAYHRLADHRTFLGIPNALNVLSNAPFVVVGALGAWMLRPGASPFVDNRERWPWGVFFIAFLLTGLGSVYYHLAPSDARLVWDRLPLAAAIMGLFAAVVAERIDVRAGLALLAPLVAVGLASVLWWHVGEARGRGDLRLYALVQFYPMVAIPVMLIVFRPRYTLAGAVMVAVGVYAFAKVFELLDGPILRLGSVVSGHTLKHVAVGMAGYVLVWMLERRRPSTVTPGRGTR